MELKKNNPYDDPNGNSNNNSNGDQGGFQDYYTSNDGQPTAPQYGGQGGSGYNNSPQPYEQPNMSVFAQYGDTMGAPAPVVIEKKQPPKWIVPVCLLVIVAAIVWMIVGNFGGDYEPGVLRDYVYTNDYFGVEISGNSDCFLNSNTRQSEDIKDVLEKHPKRSVDEFWIEVNDDDALFFSVYNYNKKLHSDSYSDSEVMTELKSYMIKEIDGMGYSDLIDVDIKDDQTDICGKTCHGFVAAIKAGSGTVYINRYYIFKGQYVGIFTTVTESKNKYKSMLKQFVTKYTGE